MNGYFKVCFPPAHASAAVLFKDTLPEFVKCNPNIKLTHADTGAVTAADRKVFATGEPEMLGVYFYRLMQYRNAEYDRAYAALKNEWGKDRPTVDVKGAVNIARCNAMLTQVCEWEISAPEKMTYITQTIDDELTVTAWHWACTLVMTVYSDLLVCTGGANEEDTSLGGLEESVAMLRKAGAVFSFLTMRGMKEGHARFDRLAPVFLKAYVCKAYEAMSLALAHVIKANSLLTACKGQTLNTDAVLHLRKASALLENGYTLLKNADGADDAGIYLPENYFVIKKTVQFYTLFYHARLVVVNSKDRVTAMSHLRKIAYFPELSHHRVEIDAMLRDFETMSVDANGNTTTYASSTFGAVTEFLAKTFVPTTPISTDSDAKRIVELLSLPALARISGDVPEIRSPRVENLIFRQQQPPRTQQTQVENSN